MHLQHHVFTGLHHPRAYTHSGISCWIYTLQPFCSLLMHMVISTGSKSVLASCLTLFTCTTILDSWHSGNTWMSVSPIDDILHKYRHISFWYYCLTNNTIDICHIHSSHTPKFSQECPLEGPSWYLYFMDHCVLTL